jgi:hypothetical protein
MDYPWLRLWNVMLASPKVQLLSDRDYRAWTTLLVIANQSKPRGWLPSIEHIAFHLRCTIEEANGIMGRLIDADLMDDVDGSYRPHDWDHWQPKGDAPSTQRVKEFRERRKSRKDGDVNVAETFHETEVKRFSSVSSSLTNNLESLINEDKIIQTGNVSQPLHETFHITQPSYPDPQTTMHHIDTGPCQIEDATARDIWSRIWHAWKDESLCIGWYRWQRQYLAEVWIAAFSQTKEQYPNQKISISLVAKIAAAIAVNGRKEARPYAPDPGFAGRPKTEKQIWREAAAERLKKLNEQIGDDEEDDDE